MNLPLTLMLIFSFALTPDGFAANRPKEWSRVDSEFVNLFFDGDLTPAALNRKIEIPRNMLAKSMRTPESNSPEDVLKAKLDTAFQRAETILDMYPSRIEVNVYIYSDVNELKALYKSIYKRDFENHRGEAQIISFYRYKDNAISIYANDLCTAVLVHEMAHCIISHYFIIQPPVSAQEILAMYVDQHFRDA